MVITYAPNWGVIYDRKFTVVNLLQHEPQTVGRKKKVLWDWDQGVIFVEPEFSEERLSNLLEQKIKGQIIKSS